MFKLKKHYEKGFSNFYGIEVTAISCKHCKETLLCGYDYRTSADAVMRRHISEEHPILNRIYN